MEKMAVFLSSIDKSVYFQFAIEVILVICTSLSMVSWTKEIMIFILSDIQSHFCSKMLKPHRMGYHLWFAGFDFCISYVFYFQSLTSMQSETEPHKTIIFFSAHFILSSQTYCHSGLGFIYLAVLWPIKLFWNLILLNQTSLEIFPLNFQEELKTFLPMFSHSSVCLSNGEFLHSFSMCLLRVFKD